MVVWGEPKRLQNLAKHGLDLPDLDVSFFLTASIRAAKTGRAVAIGEFQRRFVVAVVFLSMGREAISVIFMRPASRREGET